MKIVAILLVVGSILAGILGPAAFYVVDETQMAVITRFGDPIDQKLKPGLYVKTPFADKVNYFESRILLFDAPPDSLLTKDKKRLVIDVYARGKIFDPLLFYRTVGNEAMASSRAIDIVSSELRREIGLDDQSMIIKTSRHEIMARVTEAVKPKLTDFGIDIIDVRIKRADFPPEISNSIYERMKAERIRIANKERAEGAKVDLEIRSAVDKEATIISAEAERDANFLRGKGEAEAIRIFADALERDPGFYAFQRRLQALKTLPKGTMLYGQEASVLFDFLSSPPMPEITSVGKVAPP